MKIKKSLCDICSPKQWKTVSSDKLLASGYPVYGANGIIGYYSEFNHESRTLLITCRGATCGHLNICEPYSYVNGNAMALDSLSNDIDLQYLYYYLQHRGFSDVITGSAQPQIVRQSLEKINICYPKIEQQKQIVITLNKANDLILLRKQQLSKLDELVKARFAELFGDCDLSHPQEKWVAIKEIGNVIGGSTPKTDRDEYWGGVYRWITPAELQADSGYLYDSVRKLTKAGIDSCSLQEMPIGTVILSSRAPIGKVAIAGNTFYCNQGFKNIVCKEAVIPRYLYTVLLLNSDYLNSLGRGATFKEISKSIVENIHIPVPSIALQQQFAAFVEQVDKSKRTIKNSLENLEMLKKSLMQKYFG